MQLVFPLLTNATQGRISPPHIKEELEIMLKDIKGAITSLNNYIERVYDVFKKEIHIEKDNIFTIFFKVIISILIIFIGTIVVSIGIILRIVKICYTAWEDTKNHIVFPIPLEQCECMANIVGELLCHVLHSNFEVLSIKRPDNISNIIPTKYGVINTLNGQVFFRFIIQYDTNFEENFKEMCDLINVKINQQLRTGFANIEYPYYKDLPFVYVKNIAKDLNHVRHLNIDVIPVFNDSSYNLVKNLIQNQHMNEQESVDSSLYDKDF